MIYVAFSNEVGYDKSRQGTISGAVGDLIDLYVRRDMDFFPATLSSPRSNLGALVPQAARSARATPALYRITSSPIIPPDVQDCRMQFDNRCRAPHQPIRIYFMPTCILPRHCTALFRDRRDRRRYPRGLLRPLFFFGIACRVFAISALGSANAVRVAFPSSNDIWWVSEFPSTSSSLPSY